MGVYTTWIEDEFTRKLEASPYVAPGAGERTTVTEPRNPGTLRVEDTSPESAPAAPAEPARPETSAVQSTPEMTPPTSSAPEAGNQTTTAIDLPNLENLLGGGR